MGARMGYPDCLLSLRVGSLFHAEYPSGIPKTCMVIGLTSGFIHGRDICRGGVCLFDRSTGVALEGPERKPVAIVCVTPHSPAVHATFVGMDERYRLGEGEERFRLSKDEIAALLSLEAFIAENRLACAPAPRQRKPGDQ